MNYQEEKSKNSNLKKFNKIWQKSKANHLIFLSSNSGTGKSTYFKWLLVRKALKGQLKFDVFFRFENELEQKFNDAMWLKPPLNASKRLLKIVDNVTIITEDGNYFLINKSTREKLAQALSINTQKKYKSTENPIYTNYALYDEVMPDDNVYCGNEPYKFCRLIDTRARNREYRVICLYNKTQPYFPYRQYFKGSKALFIDFIGHKWGCSTITKGIQGILNSSTYNAIYTNNEYATYEEFVITGYDFSGAPTLFYIKILDKIFALKDCGNLFFLKPATKIKKGRPFFSLVIEDSKNACLLEQRADILRLLRYLINNKLIYVNKNKYSIYVKELATTLNFCYN